MAYTVKPPCDDGVIQSTPPHTPTVTQAGNLGPWILVATILGSSMAFIDGTVVNVALPVLQTDLSATVGDVQWVVEAYSLFLASLILVGGSLGDYFGRKRIFAIGISLFTISSVLCGLAPNVLFLIIMRAVQGIGGALLVPGSLAIISASFDAKRRGQAIGTWAGFTSITSAIGPVLGGWLVQNASWRWIFFINVPIAAIVLVVLFWHVPESHGEEGSARLDYLGAFLATVSLGGIVYGLIQADSTGLSDPVVLIALAIGLIALIAFLLAEARIPNPMLPLGLFRSPTFSGANLLTFFLYAALGAALFFVPFNLIRVQNYSPTEAGAANLPLILTMFFLSRWSGGLITRFGAKLPLIVGPIIAAIGFALFARPDIGGSYWTTFFPAVLVLGLGMAIAVAPLTTAVMGSVSQDRAGIASGINNAVSRAAGLLAIAVLGLVVVGVFDTNLSAHLATLDVPSQIRALIEAQRSKLVGVEIPNNVSLQVHAALAEAINQSFVASFRIVMFISSGLALLSALCSWLLIEGKKPKVGS